MKELTYTDAGGHVFQLREPKPGDEVGIADALSDWPDHSNGEQYGLRHGVRDVDQWRRMNALVPIPLPSTDPTILSLIFTRDDVVIGLARFRLWGYDCEIINEAIRPAMRGNGYSNILHEMEFRLIPIMDARNVVFQVLDSAPAINSYMQSKFTEAPVDGRETGAKTGQMTTIYRYTAAEYEARKANKDRAADVAIEAATVANVDPEKPPTLAELAPPIETAKRLGLPIRSSPQ